MSVTELRMAMPPHLWSQVSRAVSTNVGTVMLWILPSLDGLDDELMLWLEMNTYIGFARFEGPHEVYEVNER